MAVFRYLVPLLFLLVFASCKKNRESYPYKSIYTYSNNSSHHVQLALYHSNSYILDGLYVLPSGAGEQLEYTGTNGFPTPFYKQLPDSVEMIFDSTKRIIYSLKGDNGFTKNRNILNKLDPAYYETPNGPRVSSFDYQITNSDYANAR